MKIHIICAARPNFMKVAPLYHALKHEKWAKPILVHTGQHYDLNMSDAFFRDLNLPDPDIHLGVGSGSHAQQTARVMVEYEKILNAEAPDIVIVVGDVNSTVAVSMTTVKMNIPVAHLEAGLRSYDRTMPEEINRIVTDALSDILWTPSTDADINLEKEGIAKEKVRFVGNIMIDSLEMIRPKIERIDAYRKFSLEKKRFGVVTLHRPANVDDPEVLAELCRALIRISNDIPLVFPIHPRTHKNLKEFHLLDSLEATSQLIIVEPMSYAVFMNMIFNCRLAITDSGGIQEETTYLGIPCLTLRPNTERPITVTNGTNRLCRVDQIDSIVQEILSDDKNERVEIPYWDGHAADRIVAHLRELNS